MHLGELQRFGQVERFASSCLKYLLATAKTVRDNYCVLRSVTDGWEQCALSYCLGYFELVPLKTERSCHSTAA